MVLSGQPERPTPLVLHQADFDDVAGFPARLFRAHAANAVQVGLKRIGVAVKGAGVEDRHGDTGPQFAG